MTTRRLLQTEPTMNPKIRSHESQEAANQNLLMRFWLVFPRLEEILETEFFSNLEKPLSSKTREHYLVWARRAFHRLYETVKNRCLDTPDALLNPSFLQEYLTMLTNRYSINARWLMVRFTAFWLHCLFPERYPMVNPTTLASALQDSSNPSEFEDTLRALDPLFVELNREWTRRSYGLLSQIYRASTIFATTTPHETASRR